jgi:hypothetical protein
LSNFPDRGHFRLVIRPSAVDRAGLSQAAAAGLSLQGRSPAGTNPEQMGDRDFGLFIYVSVAGGKFFKTFFCA